MYGPLGGDGGVHLPHENLGRFRGCDRLPAGCGEAHCVTRTEVSGPFQSHMMAATLARAGDAIAKSNPRGRIGTPEDIAGVAIFLASRASAYTTGTVVPCDGGSAEF